MTYLLDTNACIAVINGRPAEVRDRLTKVFARGETIAVSTITLYELWYGVAKSARVEANTERLTVFVGPLEALAFDAEDARFAGMVRAALERAGKPIGAYDSMIAGQTLRHVAMLVTANVHEFERVPGLRWENWAG